MAESVADLLLRAAEIDAAACRALAALPDMSDTVVGFHAQQACEKSLKAVLGAAGVAYPRSHDLVRLIELLPEAGVALPAELHWIDAPNPYAVGARYGLVEPGGLERARTLDAMSDMLLWAKALVNRSA